MYTYVSEGIRGVSRGSREILEESRQSEGSRGYCRDSRDTVELEDTVRIWRILGSEYSYLLMETPPFFQNFSAFPV